MFARAIRDALAWRLCHVTWMACCFENE
jgi:hypothetical protein